MTIFLSRFLFMKYIRHLGVDQLPHFRGIRMWHSARNQASGSRNQKDCIVLGIRFEFTDKKNFDFFNSLLCSLTTNVIGIVCGPHLVHFVMFTFVIQ